MIDIGVNLGDKQFRSDVPAVLQRAQAAGVTGMIVTGTSDVGSERALELASEHPGYLWSTVGVHPHDAKSFSDATRERLKPLLARPEVVAVGECGLDFDRDFSPRPQQESVFAEHIEWAAESGMPLFLHERAAHQRFLEILAPERSRLGAVVVHCFTGGPEECRAYLDIDCHLGVTGWVCDERRGQDLARAVVDIPAARLMLETDAPYLMPRNIRPKPKTRRNEPANLPAVLEKVAELRGLPREEVAAESIATTKAFFGLP